MFVISITINQLFRKIHVIGQLRIKSSYPKLVLPFNSGLVITI